MPHHHHDHGHCNHHHVSNYNRAFAIGVSLNVLFVVIEVAYGMYADSLALIADAGHNLSDVFSLLLAWGATILAAKPATEKRTYGLRKATILASLTSAVLLLVALGGIAWEAIGRFAQPAEVAGQVVIIVAAIGVVINGATAMLFMSGQKDDLNIRGAYLHMMADAGISLGVVVAGVVILMTGWLWIDPAISLAIALVVLIGTWHLLRDSLNMSLDAVPDKIDLAEIKSYFENIEAVSSIHDLHVWSLSTTEVALTVHVVVDKAKVDGTFLDDIQKELNDRFGIEHATIQVENCNETKVCALDRPACV